MSDRDRLHEWLRAGEAGEAKALEKARTEAERRGKEPFDFERLAELYDVCGPMADKLHDPARMARELEYKYYLMYQEVMTLRELAEALELADATTGR